MKRLFLTAALSGLSLATAQTAPADLSGTLTLYTSEVQADVQAQVDAFKKLYPKANVQLFRSGTGEVTAKLNAELEAGTPQADLLWVADQTYFDTLSKRTLLEKLDLSGLNVPGSAVYGGTYAEVRKLYNVIGVNTNVLKTAPKSFADLKQPAYQNKLAMPNPLFSGGALSTAGTLAQRLGWEYFDALAKNGMKIEQSNPITTTKLIGGEYGAALLVDYALRREAAKGAPIQIVYPTEGAILVPTPIGVLKSSKNKGLAQAFVRFLYSPAAQANFSRLSYVPVMPGAPRPAGVPASVPTLPSAAAYISANKAEIGQRFSTLFNLK